MGPEPLDARAFEAAVRRLFGEVAVMTLATAVDGRPWAADVYFAADGYDLVFLSSPRSRHSRNLAINPACAATIHPLVESWLKIRGLQIEGQVGPPAGTLARTRALTAYLAKFPFARDLIAPTGEGARALASATLQVLRPSRLHYLDNALGVGTRYCLRLVEGRASGPPELELRE